MIISKLKQYCDNRTEKKKLEYLEEQNLKEYIKILQDISNRNYSSQNYKAVHACDHAVKLIKAELDTFMEDSEEKKR